MNSAEVLVATTTTVFALMQTMIAFLYVRGRSRESNKKWPSLHSTWLRVWLAAFLLFAAVDLWMGRTSVLRPVYLPILIVGFGGFVALDIGRGVAGAISAHRNRFATPATPEPPEPLPSPTVVVVDGPPDELSDPGWIQPVREMATNLIPIYGQLKVARREQGGINSLISLRFMFLILLMASFYILLALALILPRYGAARASWVVGIVAIAGLLGLIRIRSIRKRRLSTDSRERLLGSYRTHFYVGVGYAEAPSMIALLGAVLFSSGLWVYLVGLAFSLLGLSLIAPTRGDIERGQRQIEAQESSLSLLEALMAPPPKDQGSTRF